MSRKKGLFLVSLEQGFFIKGSLFSSDDFKYIQDQFDCVKVGAVPGQRHFSFPKDFIDFLKTSSCLNDLVQDCLGEQARLVRLIAFDKTPDANWGVPWHQDRTIAVVGHGAFQGFEKWRRKGDFYHVEPPVQMLEAMVTLRVHLDDADETNGALKVVPKSHLRGRLMLDQISNLVDSVGPKTCCVQAGDVMVMSPLLVHSSHPAVQPTHRRVLHLEYCSVQLPEGLKWTV